jgi:plasmid stabilization system protein ParE
MSSGYALPPEACADLDDIRHYIAQENPDAADGVISEIFDSIRGLCLFPIRVTDARTSVRGLCGSLLYVNI